MAGWSEQFFLQWDDVEREHIKFRQMPTCATGLKHGAVSAAGTLTEFWRNGSPAPYTTTLIKGIQYATFLASAGAYQAVYGEDTTPPTVSSVNPASGAAGVAITTAVTATFSEAVNASTINTNTIQLRNPSNALILATVTYDAIRTRRRVDARQLPWLLGTIDDRGGGRASGRKTR
jgi:hypothetical protein